MKCAPLALAAVGALAFAVVGCDTDSCPEGQHSVAVGSHQVWVQGHTTYVNGRAHTTPGHFSTVTDYECRADN